MHAIRINLIIGTLLFSAAARLTANPTINTQPSSASFIMGAKATFTVAATASVGPSLGYQWQYNSGSGWSNLSDGGIISGSATGTLKIDGPPYDNSGVQVRCFITDTGDSNSVTSNAATMTLTAPAPFLILAHPFGKPSFQGDATASFTVVTSGTVTGYRWQLSTDGGNNWSNLTESAPYSGTTTSTLTIADPYTNLGGVTGAGTPNKYRCVVSNSGSSYTINSKGAALTIFATPGTPPTITTLVNGSAASSIATNDPSPITVQVSAIAGGGTVRIDRYADLNGNGVIDPGEPLVQSMLVRDGTSIFTYGGVTDPNIPSDADNTADGTVNAVYYLKGSGELGQAAGKYLFRVVSGTGAFAPVTSGTFTYTQPEQSTTVSGTVTDGATPTPNPVPYARVALLDSNSNFVSAVVADGSGVFSISAAPGQYIVFPLASGYVLNQSNAQQADTTASLTVSGLSVVLTPAGYMNVVQLQDQNSGAALRGVQLFMQSKNGYIGMADSDAGGVVAAGAVADLQWGYDPSSASLSSLGYVRPSNNNGGDNGTPLASTNSTVTFQAANAMIYGTLTDNSGTPVPLANVDIQGTDQNNNYGVDATTDANGRYYIPVYGNGGSWNVNVDSSNPIFGTSYSVPNSQNLNTVAAGTAYQVNFVAPVVTAHLSGTVTNNGTPAGGVQLDLFGVTGSGQNLVNNFVSSVTTDNDGNFSFGVSAGNWSINLDNTNNSRNLVGPLLSFPNVTESVTGIAYHVSTGTGTISGAVTDQNGSPVNFDNVTANAKIGEVTYNAGAQTGSDGHYSFPVIDGTWNVSAGGANGVSYPTQSPTVTGSTTVNFAAPVYTSHLQGTVTNNSSPVSGVQVGAKLQNGGQFVQATTDSNGHFDLGVNAGTWYVYLNNNPTLVAAGVSETIGDNQTIPGIALNAVTTTGAITGQVKDGSDNALANVNLYATATIDSVTYNFGTQTDGTGHYSFPIIAGSWMVGINGNPNGLMYTSQAVDVAGTPPTTNTVNFTPIVFTAHFQGTVLNNGTPVAGLQVGANLFNNSSYPNLAVQATTDAGGNFDLAVLGSGSGYWNIQVRNASAQNLVGQNLNNQTIADGQTISGLTLHVLASTGTMSGTVHDLSGSPAANVFVSANANIGGVTYNAGAQSGSNGSYSFLVFNGTWNVQPGGNGLNFASQSVVVNSATTTANFAATVISQQPFGQTATAGQSASFQIQTNAPGSPTVQWQLSTDGGANWSDVPASAPYSGTTNGTLSINPVTIGLNGYSYRSVVTFNGGASSETSQAATLTVSLAPGPGVEVADAGFSRPQFRRLSLPDRVTVDQATGKLYATMNIFSSLTGLNNQRLGAVFRLNADGSADNSFNSGGFLALAWAIVPLANGQVLVGAQASNENAEGGLPLYRVFRLNANGSLDGTYRSPVFIGLPRFMTLQGDGKLLVAPTLPGVDNGGISTLARLNTDGSLDKSFTMPAFDGQSVIFAPILLDGSGNIIIGGTFSTVNGAPRDGVARLNPDGSVDTTFVPSGYTRTAPGTNKQVRGLGFQTQGGNAGKLIVVGKPFNVGGVTRTIIRLNSDGSLDNSFTLLSAGQVIPTANGNRPRMLSMLAGDQFAIVSDTVTRFNADGSIDNTYARPVLNKEAYWMDTLADGTVLVPMQYGTTFTANSVTTAVSGPVRITPGGTLDGTFTPGPFQTEAYPGNFAIQPNGQVLVWGNFDTVNTTARHGMARINADGSLDPFNLSGVANLYSIQDATLLGNGQILATTQLGSYENSISTTLTTGVSRFNSDGTVDPGFTLDPSANVLSFHQLPNGQVLGWNLDAVSLLANSGVSFKRLNTNGTIDNTFPGLGAAKFGAIYRDGATEITEVVQGAFQVTGHYADGRMIAIATVPNGSYPQDATSLNFTVLRLNPDGTLDPGFTAPSVPWATVPASFGNVTDVAIDLLNPSDGPNQWPVVTANSSPFTGAVPQADGSVIVYGAFTSLGGSAAPGLARLTNTGAFDASFNVGSGPQLLNQPGRTALIEGVSLAPNGQLWVTGLFDTFGGVPAPGIVRLNPDGTVDSSFYTDISYQPYLGNGTKVGFGPSGEVIIAGTFAEGVESFPSGLTRLRSTVAPLITSQSSSQSATAGSRVTLNVGITPGVTAAYQWFFNEVPVNGATTPTLVLSNVQPASAGSYTVVVTNANGSANSTAINLTVSAAAPEIVTPPASTTVAMGSPASFGVTVSGAGPFTYQWFHNGAAVPASNSPTLNLGGVQAGDEGYYTATITEGGTTLVTRPALLAVTDDPDVLRQTPGIPSTQFKMVAGPSRVYVDGRGGLIVTDFFNGFSSPNNLNGNRLDGVLRIDAATGAPDLNYARNPQLSVALAAAPQPDGTVIVAGSTETDQEPAVPRVRLFRYRTDGTLDPNYHGAFLSTNYVRFLTLLSDGRLLVCASSSNPPVSTQPGAVDISVINRFLTDGTRDPSFTPPVLNAGGFLFAEPRVDSQGRILIAGLFTSVNGTPRSDVARLNPDGSLDTSFTASGFAVDPGNVQGIRAAVPVAGDKVLIGGRRMTVDGTLVALARLNLDGSLDTDFTLVPAATFGLPVSNQPNQVNTRYISALPDGRFYAGVANQVIRFLANGTVDSSFAPVVAPWAPGTHVFTQFSVLADGTVYTAIDAPVTQNGVTRTNILKINPDGTLDPAFTAPEFAHEVFPTVALPQTDGAVIVGGGTYGDSFNRVGTSAKGGLVRIRADGTLDPGFNAVLPAGLDTLFSGGLTNDGRIYALVSGTTISTDGAFSPTATSALVRYNPDGSIDGGFTPPALPTAPASPSTDYTGTYLRVQGNQAYLFRNSVADVTAGTATAVRLNPDGSVDTNFNLSTGAMGALDNDNGVATLAPFDPIADLPGGGFLMVTANGPFTTTDTSFNVALKKLKLDGTYDPAFTAPVINVPAVGGSDNATGYGTNLASPAYTAATVLADGRVLVAGRANSYGAVNAPGGVALLDVTGAPDPAFAAALGAGPQTLRVANTPVRVDRFLVRSSGKILVTGSFDTWAGKPAPGIIQLNSDGSLDQGFYAGVSYYSYLQSPTNLVSAGGNAFWLLGQYRRGATGWPEAINRLEFPGGATAQTITFNALPDVAFTTAPLPLSASSDSGLTVTFLVDSGPATVTGNNLTLTGTGMVTVRASQAGDGTYAAATDVVQSFNVTASFASWQQSVFTPTDVANPAVSGPNAVYGQDGLPNLVKYALGLNPKQNVTSGLPAVSTSGGNWTYTYVRPTSVTDVAYTVQYSTDLTNWTDLADSSVGVSGGMDTRQATYAMASAPNVFFRLVVTR